MRVGPKTDTGPVPDRLQQLAAISWRLLAVFGVVYVLFLVSREVAVVVVATVLALFPASLMWGPVAWLKRRGWRPALATTTAMVAVTLVVVGLGFLVGPSLVEGLQPLVSDVSDAYDALLAWLVDGPLGLSEAQLNEYTAMIQEQLTEQAGRLGTGFLSGAAAAVQVLLGALLSVVVVFFVLKDGDRFGDKALNRLSPERADRLKRGVVVGWNTLNRYVRGLALVGLIDALAIGIGLLILGVPLVLPLAMLVFVGGFLPVIGAFTSGLVAVAVALVNGGLTDALIVLAIILLVQRLEGDILYPIVFGRTMQLHPLVILLALSVGGIAFGILGAFLAVPISAVVVAVNQELSEDPDGSLLALAQTID
ncbi:MAG: AI-2E family transporter [Acidimicrobiia bacterium]|nr:AI-2E family transporter [Acidimicrobiia bacterium]